MIRKRSRVLVALIAVAIAAAACSSSGGSSSSNNSSSGKAYKIGLLVDLTGLAASGNKTAGNGVKAGIAAAKAAGYNLTFVTADTASSPAGALAAAQKLVNQDHVDVVIANSALAFAAAQFLGQNGMPVIGFPEDGPEWQTAKNMFAVIGALHTDKVATTFGEIFKNGGATNIGTLGYGISPTSSQSAKGAAESAKAAGLKAGYVNANFAFGSTNVQPVAIAMKNKGIDGVTMSVDPNTSYALIDALRNLGVKLKVAYLATGYGADTSQAGPKTLQSAQGVYFSAPYQPVEMKTPATQRFQQYLQQTGTATAPTFAEYNGYVSVLLLDEGLKAAGSKTPSKTALITALSGVTSFTADGLFGDHPANPNDRTTVVAGPDNCLYVTKFNGTAFDLVKNEDPICGTIVPGVTVK
jgi:branched-chain amino acid transport system substrate-binding protein